jgi:hypothetical protein
MYGLNMKGNEFPPLGLGIDRGARRQDPLMSDVPSMHSLGRSNLNEYEPQKPATPISIDQC